MVFLPTEDTTSKIDRLYIRSMQVSRCLEVLSNQTGAWKGVKGFMK